MRSISGAVLTTILLTIPVTFSGQSLVNPHEDPDSGVLRVLTTPSTRGQCIQCHPMRGKDSPADANPKVLFTENTNMIAFWNQGAGMCHPNKPVNYPLTESDRLPDTSPDAGYPEANDGGVRRVGVEYRGRWPGQQAFTNPAVGANGRYISPHAMDPDMPRTDPMGEGLCLNCHDPHGESGHNDLLVERYGGIGGSDTNDPPAEYRLCLSCHGVDGPAGMEAENQYIEDYYDRGLNGDTAGHQIRRNADIALSWPSHVNSGDRLACYDCHNPHGSIGYNGVEPNGFLLSDQRPGWSGLTDTRNSPEQARRFCLGCHIPTDGIPGSQTVQGIVMNTLPDEDPAHYSTATRSCYDCHGADYSGPTSHNVHNPAKEPDHALQEADDF